MRISLLVACLIFGSFSSARAQPAAEQSGSRPLDAQPDVPAQPAAEPRSTADAVPGPAPEPAERRVIEERAPVPPTQPGKDAPGVRWDEGATVIDMTGAHLEISNKVWAVFLLQLPDDDTSLQPAGPGGEAPRPGTSRSSFRIRKAETTFEGWFWQRNLAYELELTYRDEGGVLNHAMLDWDVAGTGDFVVQFGQFKAGFGRQELTSSSRLQFVSRSFVSDMFAPAEQIGAMVHGRVIGDRLEYMLGAFNGNGRNQDFNDSRGLQYNLRLQLEPWGQVGYSESDFESSEHPLVAFAVQAQHDDSRGSTTSIPSRRITGGGDLTFKWKGFSLFSEAFWRDEAPARRTGEDAFRALGTAVQAGCFVYQHSFEVAARFAYLDPRRGAGDDGQSETGVAFNLFVQGHKLKVQTDFRRLEDKGRNAVEYQGRLQTYFSF